MALIMWVGLPAIFLGGGYILWSTVQKMNLPTM